MEKPISAHKAAFMLGVGPGTVGRWFRNGKFPNAFQVGKGVIRIPLSDIEAIKHQPFLEAGLPTPEAREAV